MTPLLAIFVTYFLDPIMWGIAMLSAQFIKNTLGATFVSVGSLFLFDYLTLNELYTSDVFIGLPVDALITVSLCLFFKRKKKS